MRLSSPILKMLSESLLNPQMLSFAPQAETMGVPGTGGPPPPQNLSPGMGPQPSTAPPRNPQAAFAPIGTSPYMPSVTATDFDGRTTAFAEPNRPNLNFLQRQPSLSIAQAFGGQVNTSQDPQWSQPMYSVSFPNQPNHLGYEVDMPTGQIQFWRDRGDPDWLIAARLGLTQGYDPNWKGNI